MNIKQQTNRIFVCYCSFETSLQEEVHPSLRMIYLPKMGRKSPLKKAVERNKLIPCPGSSSVMFSINYLCLIVRFLSQEAFTFSSQFDQLNVNFSFFLV